MAAAPPPAPANGQLAIRSSASPSIPVPRPSMLLDEKIPEHLLHGGVGRAADSGSEGGEMGTDGMGMVGGQDYVDDGDSQMDRGGGGKRQQCKKVAEHNRPKKLKDSSLVPNITKISQVQVGEGKHHTENEPPKPTSKKSRNSKGYLPIGSKSSRSPIHVASSPGVNMLARSATSRSASFMARSASLKRAKMASSPETSQRSPSCTMASPLPDLPHVSPSLEDLSLGTRTTNSQASKRRRRKLISSIWTEAVPIYRDGRLVEGRRIHFQQVFRAARDTGTSNIKRNLKVCEAKTTMNEMVEKMGQMGRPEGIDPNWKFNPVVARRKLVKMPATVCKLLEVFYTATICLSGSKFPTSHLYFYQLWNIKKMLNKEESSLNRKILNKDASSQDITIARMVKQMQIKFNQYWKETYMFAYIPVVLDPRFKYELLEYLLSDFGNEEEASTWMGEVKKTMQKLFNEYSLEVSVQPQRENDTQGVEDDDDPLADWDQFMRSNEVGVVLFLEITCNTLF